MHHFIAAEQMRRVVVKTANSDHLLSINYEENMSVQQLVWCLQLYVDYEIKTVRLDSETQNLLDHSN